MSANPAQQLACQRDPEQWFIGAHHDAAVRACLQCPRKRWCASQALETRASFGMWAGIWVDDNLADVAPRLQAIVEQPAVLAAVPAIEASGAREAIAQRPPLEATGVDDRRRAVVRVITARSSGHCEVMTQGCRYSFDTLGSRLSNVAGADTLDAACAYAACTPCQQALESTNPGLLRSLGYLVKPPARAAGTAFYWRQARWVYLDGGPAIQSTSPDAVLRPAI